MNTRNMHYAFIAKHYRDPGGTDPIRRWLPHPEVARTVCAALLANGIPHQDLEDRLQDVYVRVLTAVREGGTVPPADLRAMKAYCAKAAANVAMDVLREIAKKKRDLAATCAPKDEKGKRQKKPKFALPEPDRREPDERADASQQVEVLGQLFREGRMPRDGVAILEGVAAGFSYREIAQKLGISRKLVDWRMREMRDVCRRRMTELGMIEPVRSLRLVVSNPAAMPLLREAA
jgi:RNA polymerase sigma factor (sigma-70 family)